MRQWRKKYKTWVSYPIVYLTCRQRSNYKSKKKALAAVLTFYQSGLKVWGIEDKEITGNHVPQLVCLYPVVDSAERFLEYNTTDFTCLQF